MKTLFRSVLLAVLIALPVVLQAQTTARYPFLEQFTGTWCQYCPFGADTVNAILARIPNARAIAYHDSDPMSTPDGDAVKGHLMVSAYPTAAIDRLLIQTPTGNAIAISRAYWGQVMSVRNQAGAPMSISVTGTYHQDTREIAAVATINVLQALTGEFYFNAVLTEDSLNYQQTLYIGPGQTTQLNPYYHKRVVRNMITGPFGITLTTTGFTANQNITQPISFTVPANYDISKCKLSVFITTKITLTVGGQPRPTQMAIQQAWQESVTSALSVIPVELISFSATQDGDAVRLHWRTAHENNNRGWFVERRTVDGEWSDLGFVGGYGTTTAQQQYEFVDQQVRMMETYDYRLRQIDFDGKTDYSPIYRVMTAPVPTETRLLPNYPNPFNPNTFITVELAQESDMSVAVYDMLGRLVKTLASGVHPAGGHVFEWDGTDAAGTALPSGIYFARLSTPTHNAMQQMQLSK